MRVCDITREDEVVSAYYIVRVEGQRDLAAALDDETAAIVHIETGKRADEAFRNQNWTALGKLVPYGLRPKDPNRTAGAKKAQATRAAKKAAALTSGEANTEAPSGSTEAVAAPNGVAGANATPSAGKTPVRA